MAKKSFKKNNPAMQFITALEPDTQAEQQAQEVQEAPVAYEAPPQPSPAAGIPPADPEVQEAPLEYTTQDVQPAQALMKGTQGRKGQKFPRINMAFKDENLEYLQLISRIEGVSITEYVNRLVALDRQKQADVIEKAKSLLLLRR